MDKLQQSDPVYYTRIENTTIAKNLAMCNENFKTIRESEFNRKLILDTINILESTKQIICNDYYIDQKTKNKRLAKLDINIKNLKNRIRINNNK